MSYFFLNMSHNMCVSIMDEILLIPVDFQMRQCGHKFNPPLCEFEDNVTQTNKHP